MSDGDPEERVPWPRFEVIVTRFAGEDRARYAVMDFLARTHRFPRDPFNKAAAGGLLLAMRQEALQRGEPVEVQRPKGAVSRPPRPKRERPTLPPVRGDTAEGGAR